jgi:hypothetical protein
MDPKKLTKKEVAAYCGERLAIEAWLYPPPPDPAEFPPAGWVETSPGVYSRSLTAEQLRKELFGDPERDEWERQARQRIAEIDEILIPVFFPKVKEEGTQRATKHGFVAMLKTGLTRKIDVPVLATVIAKAQEIADNEGLTLSVEDSTIEWKPDLKLKEYRALPDVVRDHFENALITSPTKTVFEIVKEEV